MNEAGKKKIPEHYAPAGKILHWITAFCVIVLIPAGIVMGNMKEGALQDRMFNLHQSLGLTVLILMLARLLVRFVHGAPPPYAGLTRFERIASTATHHLLYLLLILLPIGGWLMTSAFGSHISYFGLFELPLVMDKNEALGHTIESMHKAGGIFAGVLVLLHIGGALMHTFVKRDIVLWRMLPRSWS